MIPNGLQYNVHLLLLLLVRLLTSELNVEILLFYTFDGHCVECSYIVYTVDIVPYFMITIRTSMRSGSVCDTLIIAVTQRLKQINCIYASKKVTSLFINSN